MKLYIDDLRPCPNGYVLARTYAEALDQLRSNTFDEISLDHDLGEEKTGYDILCWIEWQVFTLAPDDFANTVLKVHSANPVGRQRMLQVIESIKTIKKHHFSTIGESE